MNAPDQMPRQESVEQLHSTLMKALIRRCGLPPHDASSWADAIIEVLRQDIGGSKFYLHKTRPNREERILRLAGPGPHSRKHVLLIAREVQCSVATVWRTLAKDRGPA